MATVLQRTGPGGRAVHHAQVLMKGCRAASRTLEMKWRDSSLGVETRSGDTPRETVWKPPSGPYRLRKVGSVPRQTLPPGRACRPALS